MASLVVHPCPIPGIHFLPVCGLVNANGKPKLPAAVICCFSPEGPCFPTLVLTPLVSLPSLTALINVNNVTPQHDVTTVTPQHECL